MKYFFTFFLIFICFISTAKQKDRSDRIINNNAYAKIIGTNNPDVKYIPPPLEFYTKSDKDKKGKIIVNYNNFAYYPRKSFQFAVSIIESILNFEDTIIIDAYWKELSGSTLGSCGPTYFYKNYDGFTFPDVYYPSPLAEKLSPIRLKDDNNAPDMIASFNSTVDWYTKTDGDCPPDKYDLPSVILHEICHGLGITGNLSYINGIGSYGFSVDASVIFDQFIYYKDNGEFKQVIQYENNSKELGDILTSNKIYFQGAVTSNEISSPIKLYSPSEFNPGSSIYHIVYPFGDNDLMRFSTGYGAVIHDPGPVVNAMLADMGWKSIRINHKKIKNTEKIENIVVEATITADFESEIVEPTLYYSIDSSEYVQTPLTSSTQGKFEAVIPLSESSHINYYLSAKDKYNRTYNLPTVVPDNPYHFYAGEDTVNPIIEHMPITFLLPEQDSIEINAKITDDFDINTARVNYRINKNKWENKQLINQNNNNFSSIIYFTTPLKENDTFDYYITASDNSSKNNTALSPETDYYSVTVEPIPEYINIYEANFDLLSNDFLLQGFEIKTAPDFENAALHTEHPYLFAGEDNSIDYIAQLRYPIKISEENHFIQFDQIVLVEPGEPETEFGDEEFWDYVIVEGSKDNGKTWKEIDSGWDSRINTEWEEAYNKGLFQNNSQTVAISKMYKSILIDITSSGFFFPDDIILIRFRLFSDPYAYGWGWVIDNLKIQTTKLSSNQYADNSNFSIYPNPVKNNTITLSSNNNFKKPVGITIFNLKGQKVFNKDNILNKSSIHLPNNLNGLYIIRIDSENSVIRNRKLIIQ